MHNPDADGFREKWTVSGLDKLNLVQYRETLQYLGDLGLNVSINEERERSNRTVTQQSLLRFAQRSGLHSQYAKRVWTNLTSSLPAQASDVEAAGIRYIVSQDQVVGVTWESLFQAHETGILSTVRGFRDPESGTAEFIDQYLQSREGRFDG